MKRAYACCVHRRVDSDGHLAVIPLEERTPLRPPGAISSLTFGLKGGTLLAHIYCSLEKGARFSASRARMHCSSQVCASCTPGLVCHRGSCPTGTISGPLHHGLGFHWARQMTCAGSANVTYHMDLIKKTKSNYSLQRCTDILMI